jgi:hypothetical protein
MFASGAELLNSVNAAAGQAAKLQATASNSLGQAGALAKQASAAASGLQPQGPVVANQSSVAGNVPAPIGTVSAPPLSTATIETQPPPVVTETKKDENCGEMRKMFQEVVRSSFTDKDTTENEMLVGLITKMTLENNIKFLKAIVSTFPIPNQSMRIRFTKNLTRKLSKENLILTGGGKSSKQKRKQRKNVTKRRR